MITDEKSAALKTILTDMGSVLVAYSGGVDSTLLLKAALDALGPERVLAVTAETMGSPVERLYDVGVVGIHRLLGSRKQAMTANMLVVAAGMEGALASVVSGLVN